MPHIKNKTSKPINSTEVDQLKERLARSMADYVNLEKRIERDKDLIATLATSSIISQMVQVLDNFYLAQSHLNDAGLKMAIDQFISILKNFGLEEINPQDQLFNPQTMECIKIDQGKDNHVLIVSKKGYSLNGQIIRPAQVIVGKKAN